MRTLIRNIKELVGVDSTPQLRKQGKEMAQLETVKDAYLIIEDGIIKAVNVLKHHETTGVGSVAVDWLPARIVEANSVDIDGITGATVTSDAIKTAVEAALQVAGLDQAA